MLDLDLSQRIRSLRQTKPTPRITTSKTKFYKIVSSERNILHDFSNTEAILVNLPSVETASQGNVGFFR